MQKESRLLNITSGMTVLIVEDEPELLTAYTELMSPFFQHIHTATDGVEALNLLDQYTFDIVFTDIRMPNMDGIELLAIIRHQYIDQQVIAITAHDDRDTVISLIDLQINAMIKKPIRKDHFVNVTYNIASAVAMQKQTNTKIAFQEEALINSNRLAQMGEMINMIAHQWRQPLTVISTQLSTIKLRRDIGYYTTDTGEIDCAKWTDDFESMFVRADSQIQELSATIEDFRNFFKSDKEKSTFFIRDVFGTCLHLLGPSLGDIKVTPMVDNSKFFGNKRELQQTLMILMNNAKDQINSMDMIEGQIFMTAKTSDNVLSIKIMDNAGGIPKDVLPRLFEPYFTTKGSKNGTGIGLYMAKTIVEKNMAGILEASNINKGACFTIKLPI